MKTKTKRNNEKNKNINEKNKSKTIKNKSLYPSLKILKKGYPLYASKQYEGSSILEYNKNEELKYNDKCLMQNSSWFGDLNVAKSYKTKDTNIYKWNIKKITNLLNINAKNLEFINNIFKKTKISLVPTIHLNKEEINKINYETPYLQMDINERALYEFKFCFGFITVKEQYEFMKFIKYLIENKILDIKRRDGKSILSKLNLKINYYKVASLLGKKENFNRLSFYDFDKHAIMNLCKIINNTNHKISGVYQKNDTSFWFPDFVVYKMDIQEYILFNPQDNLEYDTSYEDK
jgi:hypothetical protein